MSRDDDAVGEFERLKQAVERDRAKGKTRAAGMLTTAFPDTEPAPESTVSKDLESWWLPEPVGKWVDAISAFAGTPKTMAIAAALCAAATVVQGKVCVEIAPGFRQPLTLWWAVLARTGGRKTSIFKPAVAPILAMQAAEQRRIAPDVTLKTNERARLEAQITRMRRTTKAHVHTDGSNEILFQLRELERELVECQIPVSPQWVYDNINPPMLPAVLERNLESEDECARIAIWGEEGTFLANLLGRHMGSPMAETLNQGYSGSGLHSTRKLEGTRQLVDVHIDEIFVTLCVFAQPHYREKLRNQELADNGFLGRLLISECEVGPRPRLGSVSPPSPEVLEGYAAWLQRLAAIPAGTVYALSDTARAILDDHMRETDALAMAGDEGAGWAIRSPERIARIVALCGLDDAFGKPGLVSDLSDLSYMSGGSRAHGEGIKTKHLISSIYIPYLRASQDQEPANSAPRRDAVSMLKTWVTGLTPVTPGEIWTSRQMLRAKSKWRRERVIAAAHELVAMGILERTEAPTRAGDKTIKEVFRIVRLSLEAPPALRVVPNQPEPDELEP